MADNSNEVKIKVNADGSNAVSTISRVVSSLRSIRTSVMSVMRALGTVTWAVQAVQMAIEGFRKLHEWLNRAATAAAELRRNLALDGIDTRLAHAVERYKRLCDQISQANKLEKERNQILDARLAKERDLDDANAELGRQREIAALDPAAKDYQERVGEINRRYQRQAAEATAARGDEDAERRAKAMYAEADRKDKEAAALRREYERRDRIADRAVENRNDLERELHRDPKNEKLAEAAKKADEQWKAAFDAAKEVEKAMVAAEREAASLRRRAGEELGIDLGARKRRDARLLEIDSEGKRESAERKQRADEEDRRAQGEQRKFEERMSSAQEREDFDRTLKSVDDEEKVRILGEREAAKRDEKDRALAELKEEMAKPTEARNEERVSELRRQAEEAQREEFQAHDQREAAAKSQREEADRFLTGVMDANQVGSNRLTAMGLGSGVTGSMQVANDVRRLVRLVEDNVAATKGIKLNVDTTSTYTE